MARHLQLVARMAQTAGADPAEAAARGALSQKDWAALVTRCRSCVWADGCARWLEEPHAMRTQVPGTCPNRARFEALAKAAAAAGR
jgi:hypothetical protein